MGLTPHNISSVAPSAAPDTPPRERYPFRSERERLGPQKRHQVQHSVDLATRGADLTECLRNRKRRPLSSLRRAACRSAGSVVSRSGSVRGASGVAAVRVRTARVQAVFEVEVAVVLHDVREEVTKERRVLGQQRIEIKSVRWW